MGGFDFGFDCGWMLWVCLWVLWVAVGGGGLIWVVVVDWCGWFSNAIAGGLWVDFWLIYGLIFD